MATKMTSLQQLLLPPLLLLLCWQPFAAATTVCGPPSELCPTAGDAVLAAQDLCGGAPVAEALLSVGLRLENGDDDQAADAPALLVLEKHGFRTALDLQFLDADGVETAELMEQLQLGGERRFFLD
eukprot:SAG31_NODE_13353_length_875_cov_0.862113_1_plen_126_part_00